MNSKPAAIIVMKVGPHSGMSLKDIIISKKKEEEIHKVHYWGYSGNFCIPEKTQQFCKWAEERFGESVMLILIETKSAYSSKIGMIAEYSENGTDYIKFKEPVQLQGAKYSFVTRNLREIPKIFLGDYEVVYGKNEGRPLPQHFQGRISKSFAQIRTDALLEGERGDSISALAAELVYPYAVWLRE